VVPSEEAEVALAGRLEVGRAARAVGALENGTQDLAAPVRGPGEEDPQSQIAVERAGRDQPREDRVVDERVR
jgi:hypothetical protein